MLKMSRQVTQCMDEIVFILLQPIASITAPNKSAAALKKNGNSKTCS